MSRTVDRLRCDRRHKQHHVLATLTADDDGTLRVETREAAATPGGMVTVTKHYRDADIGELASLVTVCTCGCGTQFHVDVAAFMRREPIAIIRVEPESTTGVSYNRRRHNGPIG